MSTIRPFNLRRDLDGMTDLIEVAFAEERARTGNDLRAEIKAASKVLPLLLVLERISDTFRHVFDGFVCEDQGRIIAMVNVSRAGLNKHRWLIGNVATHPDYRGQGLARQLVNKAVEHARACGAEICVLDVRDDNIPAYNLYTSMGFTHYDSTIDLILKEVPQVKALPVTDLTLRPMKVANWQPRYDLALRETPAAVQEFLPVNIKDYRVTTLERLIQPLVEKLQKVDVSRFAVEKDDLLVAYFNLAAQRNPKLSHHLALRIDPQFRPALTEPLLTLAFEKLQAYPHQKLETSVRKDNQVQRDILAEYGFEEVFVMHRLGLKLVPA